MLTKRSWWAVPLALAAFVGLGSTPARAEIRDTAGMFDRAAVRSASSIIDRIEREYGVPVVVETIDSLGGDSIEDASLRHAQRSGSRGVFVLISKADHKIEVRDFKGFLGRERDLAIRQAFIDGLKKRDFDGALNNGVTKIRDILAEGGGTLRPPAQAARGRLAAPVRQPAQPPAQRGSSWGPLIGIALVILGFVIVIRILGSLFGGGNRAYGPPPGAGGPMAGPGPRGYYGPGYGGGYGGGGGGGFLSSLFGGIGGAMAGNWLYDRMSGRHYGGGSENPSYTPTDAGAPDSGSTGADWGSPGDAGGDWGGGGDGGGGGGGDWGGGGGGDWGGGGGGDWGGGGDGGGGGDW